MAAESKLPRKAVVDASFVLALLLPDEKREGLAKKTLDSYQKGKISFFAPELLKFEVANGLRTAVKRKRISQKLAQKLLAIFIRLKINYQKVAFNKVLNLSLRLNLSAYDASYLALSRQLKLKFLTLDSKLARL